MREETPVGACEVNMDTLHLDSNDVNALASGKGGGERKKATVDDAVDCPVEVPAWFMGLYGILGDLPCGVPRGAVIEGKGAGCDWAPCFSHRLNEM